MAQVEQGFACECEWRRQGRFHRVATKKRQLPRRLGGRVEVEGELPMVAVPEEGGVKGRGWWTMCSNSADSPGAAVWDWSSARTWAGMGARVARALPIDRAGHGITS